MDHPEHREEPQLGLEQEVHLEEQVDHQLDQLVHHLGLEQEVHRVDQLRKHCTYLSRYIKNDALEIQDAVDVTRHYGAIDTHE